MLTDKQKEDYISLLALDMPMSEILDIVGVSGSEILEARVSDGEFDRKCEVGLRQQRSIILSGISKVEKDMLAGKYAFSNSGAAQVIKSLQWRLEYLDSYIDKTTPIKDVGEAYVINLIEQVGAV